MIIVDDRTDYSQVDLTALTESQEIVYMSDNNGFYVSKYPLFSIHNMHK